PLRDARTPKGRPIFYVDSRESYLRAVPDDLAPLPPHQSRRFNHQRRAHSTLDLISHNRCCLSSSGWLNRSPLLGAAYEDTLGLGGLLYIFFCTRPGLLHDGE